MIHCSQLRLALSSPSVVRLLYRYHRPSRVVTGTLVGVSDDASRVRVVMDDGEEMERNSHSFATCDI